MTNSACECESKECIRCRELLNVKESMYKHFLRVIYEAEAKRLHAPPTIGDCVEKPCICLECDDSDGRIDIGCGCIAGKCICMVCLEPESCCPSDVCECGCVRSKIEGQNPEDPGNPETNPCYCHLPFPECEKEEEDDCPGCEFCICGGLASVKH